MKSKRQEKILELILDHSVQTQEQLLAELEAAGFRTTQATISRDIKQLRIIKELGPHGTYRYSTAPKPAEHDTATAVCRMRGLKPGIVSFHVDRLVTEGYLLRRSVPGDRRKTMLLCTEKAAPIIAQGRVLQHSFAEQLASGLSEEDLAHFRRCIAVFDRNIERIRTETCKRRETQP